jgi:hypothetical protein
VEQDLLVLLVPRVEGVPLEACPAGQTLEGVLGVHPQCTLTSDVPDPQAVQPRGSPAQLLRVLLVDEDRRVDVGDRDVELRIIRPLPHVDRGGGVHHDPTGEYGADPSRNRLDVVHRNDRLRIVRHRLTSPLISVGGMPYLSLRSRRQRQALACCHQPDTRRVVQGDLASRRPAVGKTRITGC